MGTETDVTGLLEKYRHYLVNSEKSNATIEKYLRDVKRFFDFLTIEENNGKGEVTKDQVMEYKTALAAEYKPASVNSMLAALNSFLVFWEKPEYRVKLLKIQRKVFTDKSRELTREEYVRLVEEARKEKKERLALLMETLCGTGIRISELSDVTVEAVVRGYAQVSCKGKERIVLIPVKLQEKLKEYYNVNHIRSGCIFVTRSGHPINRSNIWTDMNHLCQKADVSMNKVFPHNMRHLFARTYYTKQKDIVHLADILGHSSIETTRIYTMTTSREHEEQLNQMGLII